MIIESLRRELVRETGPERAWNLDDYIDIVEYAGTGEEGGYGSEKINVS